MLPSLPHYSRFHGYDYTRGAAMFITIVTEPRRALFGRVVNAKMELSPLGAAVKAALEDCPRRVPAVRLFNHIVMPDHVHFCVHLQADLDEPLKTLGAFVGAFKGYTAHLLHQQGTPGRLWQQGYHDRICVSRRFIDAANRYVDYNPLKFEMRRNHPEFLAIKEPIESPRLDGDDFWRGIGAVELLNEDRAMISLRISRRVTDIPAVVARCRKGAERFTFISGFISPGERAVLEMLLATPGAKFIKMLPSAMKHDYLPGSGFLPAIHDGRATIIARGNSEQEFDREACLDLNEEIARIAQCHGKAIYWLESGPTVCRSPP